MLMLYGRSRDLLDDHKYGLLVFGNPRDTFIHMYICGYMTVSSLRIVEAAGCRWRSPVVHSCGHWRLSFPARGAVLMAMIHLRVKIMYSYWPLWGTVPESSTGIKDIMSHLVDWLKFRVLDSSRRAMVVALVPDRNGNCLYRCLQVLAKCIFYCSTLNGRQLKKTHYKKWVDECVDVWSTTRKILHKFLHK